MTRPYLAHNGRFLRVAPDRYSALQARVEELLNPVSPKSVNKNQKVWERYAKGRAKFTELKSLELLNEVLPKAIVEHGLKYYPDPEDKASIAELDGLIHFDTTLFLLEVKAGNVDDATRRGAPEKIKRDVGGLIGKACIQAARAEEYLRRTSTPRFIRPDGSVHLVDKNRIRKVFRICVTLDHMDPLNTMLFQTAQLGGFPDSNLPWVVSLRDLFVIAEMIEFPTQFLHYLVRRRRLNELGFIHAHDELDWFGHFLQEGLYFEEWVGKDVSRLNLLTYTTQFDEWYAFSEGM
ncbi:MAG: hypothetical protein KDA68_16455 [Planctomycetaceae bacterium]|nr:hypothetical protein [Planctomycetaceae bacterium]